MEKKGNAFTGWFGGDNYRRLAALFGFNAAFYRRALGDIIPFDGMRVLDLGCGPGALSFALAERAVADMEIHGIDLSQDQIAAARRGIDGYCCNLTFQEASMDQLPYGEGEFDLVMSSMAFHETPPHIRRAALFQTARVLKPGGRFLLVDWSRPQPGLWGLVWYPMIRWGTNNQDNWNNVYPHLCQLLDMGRVEDTYLNSIARRQLFVKEEARS